MPDLIYNAIVLFVLICTVFNLCWWLYGRTLSESFPMFVVLTIMLTTLFCLFITFNLIFEEFFGNICTPEWGYITDYGKFIAYADDIARVFSGIFTICLAVFLYKDEGKIGDNKFLFTDKTEGQDSKKDGPGSGRRDLGKI